jgi:acetoin:2,6-dichlorophenolindophenol oxidoreductase subunit beta
MCGYAAEILAMVVETELIYTMEAPIMRIALPDMPAPASSNLESRYYPHGEDIIKSICMCMEYKR